MAEDARLDLGNASDYPDYFADSGDSGGGGDYFDYLSYPDYYASGSDQPIDYASYPDYYAGTDSLFNDYLNYYVELGYDPLEAASLAAQDASSPAFQLEGSAPLPPETLPNIVSDVPSYPYQTPYARLDTSFLPLPTTPETVPVAPLAQSPATQQPHLPPYCPVGQYHPYPIGDPRQDLCVPFPAAQTSQPSRPPPSGSSGSSGSSQSSTKPPAPQQPKPPVSTQCPTPGTVFDPRVGRCVPVTQVSQLTPPAQTPQGEDIFGGLKNIPLWVWLALAGVLLLSGGGEEKKKVTIQHRRAT
jgi:hypothetical protein